MRLICPSCEAQYEVDAALIPAAGRDVQCSNCSKTWFQEAPSAMRLDPEARVSEEPETEVSSGPSGDGLGDEAAAFFEGSETEGEHLEDEVALHDEGAMAELSPEDVPVGGRDRLAAVMAAAANDADDDTRQAETPQDLRSAEAKGVTHAGEVAVEAEPMPDETEIAARADHPDDAAEDESDENAGPLPPPHDLPERPGIDAAVFGILKEEADREIAARRAEAEAVETQPDLGLAEPPGRPATRPAGDGGATAPAPSGRRSLLPDIDEINSTLTATSDRANGSGIDEELPPEVAQKRRSGFRLGFSLLMLATAVLILIYLFAPQIAGAVPALEPALSGYVDWANGMRQSLDGYLERTVSALTAFLVDLST